jgi:diacylglycerol kinase (ATP)
MKKRPLLESFNYAIDGLIYVLRSQRNMRIHFFVGSLVFALGLAVGLSTVQFGLIIFAVALVIVAELINTAIEAAIDVTTSSYDPMAKIAKDVAAAAVLLAALAAVIIAYLIFFPKLNPLTFATLNKIRQSPIHLTTIALILVIMAVIAAKAWTRTGTWLRGGWPSGHAALAGCLFTAITFITRSALAATLSFIMALLVFQSRREAKFHSGLQILAGSLIGILITVIVFQLFNR